MICLLLSVERSFQAIRTKPSPCPGTFGYEESDADDDRWYGDITLKTEKNVEGATLRITLDKPSQLLVVSTYQPPIYGIRHYNITRIMTYDSTYSHRVDRT